MRRRRALCVVLPSQLQLIVLFTLEALSNVHAVALKGDSYGLRSKYLSRRRAAFGLKTYEIWPEMAHMAHQQPTAIRVYS